MALDDMKECDEPDEAVAEVNAMTASTNSSKKDFEAEVAQNVEGLEAETHLSEVTLEHLQLASPYKKKRGKFNLSAMYQIATSSSRQIFKLISSILQGNKQ